MQVRDAVSHMFEEATPLEGLRFDRSDPKPSPDHVPLQAEPSPEVPQAEVPQAEVPQAEPPQAEPSPATGDRLRMEEVHGLIPPTP